MTEGVTIRDANRMKARKFIRRMIECGLSVQTMAKYTPFTEARIIDFLMGREPSQSEIDQVADLISKDQIDTRLHFLLSHL